MGAPGAVAGVTGSQAAEPGPVPTALTARTTKLTGVPLGRPVTTVLVAVPVIPVMVRVTVSPSRTSSSKPVMGEPPSLAGAVQLTVAEVLLATARRPVGTPG